MEREGDRNRETEKEIQMREARQMDKDIEGKGGEKNRETQKEKYRGERQKIDRWIGLEERESK